jgi:hypothetical protein
MFFDFLQNAGLVGLLSMVVGALPLGVGVAYAIRPTETRLSLMRPLSLAALFAALCGSLSGVLNVLRPVGIGETTLDSKLTALGFAEALVPLFVAFGLLTVAWLCADYGLSRHP